MQTINEMANDQRPQERMELLGAQALSDSELLAILLRKGTQRKDVLHLSSDLLRDAGSLSGLLRLSREDLSQHEGIGKVKALQLLSVFEMARRILRQKGDNQPILDEPLKVHNWLFPECEALSVEKFWVLSLNRKNRLIRSTAVTTGTATASLVHPREIFREAIRNGSSAIICAHNHPSGDPSPSQSDIKVTRQLRDASKILQIEVLDHVIIGNPHNDPLNTGYYSFAESGLL